MMLGVWALSLFNRIVNVNINININIEQLDHCSARASTNVIIKLGGRQHTDTQHINGCLGPPRGVPPALGWGGFVAGGRRGMMGLSCRAFPMSRLR